MIYDDLNKKWVPSGTSHGLSKVHIYHHFINNTFRVVGRKLQDHEVRTLSLNLSGVQQKVSWRHLLFCTMYYLILCVFCPFCTLSVIFDFNFLPGEFWCTVQYSIPWTKLYCFFFEKRVMFLKRFSSSFINRFFKAGVKIQVDLTGCSLHIESFG